MLGTLINKKKEEKLKMIFLEGDKAKSQYFFGLFAEPNN